MELTPIVLLALGEAPVRALTRFKLESAWRPAPVRQVVRALMLEAATPTPAGVLAGLVYESLSEACSYVPAGSLTEALREAREAALKARVLDEIPGARVQPYEEWFAPETCILAEGERAPDLGDLVAQVSREYGRPVTLVLTVPAPHDPNWEQVRQAVRELDQRHGGEHLRRIWLISRERESGELLEQTDWIDGLSQFCHLFAYSGWSGDPDLSRLIGRDGEGRLATFGVRAYRFPVMARLWEGRKAAVLGELDRLLAVPEEEDAQREKGLLSDALAAGRDLARGRAPAMPRFDFWADPVGAENWWATMKLRWLPGLPVPVTEAVRQGLSPLADEVAGKGLTPMQHRLRLERLGKAIAAEQESLERPGAAPDLAYAFERVDEVKVRQPRWTSLIVKGLVTAMGMGAIAWTFVPTRTTATAVIALSLWTFMLVGRYLVFRRERERALAELRAETARWGDNQREHQVYQAALSQLQTWSDEVAQRHERVAESVRVLERTRTVLRHEQLPAELFTQRTAATVPVEVGVSLPTGSVGEPRILRGSEPEAILEAMLRPAQPFAVEAMLTPQGRTLLASSLMDAVEADRRVISLLLPVRKTQPTDGEPLHRRNVVLSAAQGERAEGAVWAGDDPFGVTRFVLTTPFALAGSARTDSAIRRERA